MGWTISGLQQGVDHAVKGIMLVAQNPRIRQQKYLRIFLYLTVTSFVLLGVVKLVITFPIHLLRFLVWIVSPGAHDGSVNHADDFLNNTNRIVSDAISALPFLALMFMRYAYPKPLDDLFMESLRYVDTLNPDRKPYAASLAKRKYREEYWSNMKGYMKRLWKNLRLGIIIYLLSLLPVVGQFVFPAAGAYATFKSLGQTQGAVVGICFLFLPRAATFRLIRALIGMRALMRELLEPYFVRMSMSHKEKRKWFSGRKDILFGFSAIAYILIRIPILGFLGYGVAQAAAAYMLTTVTEPPASSSSALLSDRSADKQPDEQLSAKKQ
ncbi:hypothetical protein BCR43DRAFT_529564 [Syncephalastrum racemosum]|uniref:Transmembrane protein UsgS n=1 Tax=Syncephalastrum racemosum TaxID=13706 RepID=A0A1X2HMY2_SYNRA|nr:hypothetical protein BCR43DRAFT_529564 [Syncephalastrum racemosum]